MPARAPASQKGWLARHVPILDWAPTYDRGWLRLDLIAGVTVAALVIPKALGYAGIANVPIENGLYAAAAGTILYALFGTSRQLSTGPSGALAAIAGSAVILSGVADEAVASALVAAVALAAGLVFLGMAILRMGWISQFMSKAVITGFLFGAAIDVAVGELPKLTGTSSRGATSGRSSDPGSAPSARSTRPPCSSGSWPWWPCSASSVSSRRSPERSSW